VQAVAIEQESLAIGEHDAEVIADAFVQVEPHREAECSGEIHPHAALDRVFQLLHRAHGIHYSWDDALTVRRRCRRAIARRLLEGHAGQLREDSGVSFVNGKVALKTFDKPGAPQ
jgi:hypothetical protein